MKNSSIYIVLASFVFGAPVFAEMPLKISAPTIQPKTTIIAPVPVKVVAPAVAPIEKVEQMPVDPLEKPAVSIPTTNKIIMPPDDFGKTSIPETPLEKNAMSPDPIDIQPMNIPAIQKTERPPDPLEKNTMPDDPFGMQTASLRLVNDMTKAETVSEPGKLENDGPRIFKNISEKDLEQPELATVFAKEVKTAMPGIKNITLEEKTVKVKYEREAEILGFVPVKYEMIAEGNIETGKVSVKKPWWLFFAKNDVRKFESALNDSKDTEGELNQITQLKLQAAMDRRAKTIETLSNIMKKISQTEETLAQNMK
ncbi:MAG: hypothetical protein WCT49_01160 [Candidatus Paceibacterota bacterium]|jgi:hypothetical protein|nr:hypothetical protein [Candidatus Paceibacterota bacterium]